MEEGTELFDGDEGSCCRICRLPATEEQHLFSPCKCSGSIKYVHQDCLLSWLKHSSRQRCELCNHTFQFRPIYAANAPSRLPWTDVAWYLARKSCSGIVLCLRAILVAHVWLIFIPLITCWFWRLSFKNPFLEDFDDIRSRANPSALLTDCVQGSLISAVLVFALLFATYTADHIRAYWQIMQPAAPQQPEAEEPAVFRPFTMEEGPASPDRQAGVASGNEFGQASQLDERLGYGSDETDGGASQQVRAGSSQAHSQDRSLAEAGRVGSDPNEAAPSSSGQGTDIFHDAHEDAEPGSSHSSSPQLEGHAFSSRARGPVPQGQPRPRPLDEGGEAAGLRRPRQAVQAAAAAVPVENRPAPEREFAFTELIGLQGPPRLLLENAFTVLLTIWVFMASAIWLPFMVGRAARQCLYDVVSILATSEAVEGLVVPKSRLEGTAIAFLDTAVKLLSGNATLAGGRFNEVTEARMAALSPLNRLAARLESALTGLELGDWFCLCLGYGVIISLAFVAFATFVAWKLVRNTNLRRELRSQRDLLRTAFADISHQTVQHCKYAALMAKVGLILALELTLLPALHGCWVDVCLLPLFASTLSDRLLWFQISPISFLMAHWTLGMAVLMASATFMSIFCQQLRPGALPFIRDPFARDAEPMQELILLGLGQQLERQLCAMSALACLAVVLMHLPLRLTKVLCPGVLPMQLSLTTPLGDSNLLFFNFLLPLMVSRLNVRLAVVQGLKWWLHKACAALDLEEYLLRDAAAAGGNAPPAFIPHGMPGVQDEAASEAWQREMDRVRERSGRLLALVGLLLGTMLCLNTALVILPLTIGRVVLTAVGISRKHDLYSASAGIYILWGAFICLAQAQKLFQTGLTQAAVRKLLQWSKLLLHLAGLASLGLGLLPLLIGLFVESLIMPLRLMEEQTPVFFAYHGWTIGLLAVKLGYQVLAGAIAGGARQPQVDGDGGIRCLRPVRRLAQSVCRMQAVGITRIPFKDAFKTVLWPAVAFWGIMVTVPYVASRGILPRIPFVPVWFMQVAFTYGWLVEAQALVAYITCAKLASLLKQYRARIRDQQYLLHRELINMQSESEGAS